jgi:S-adenosylmethionine hydrolase
MPTGAVMRPVIALLTDFGLRDHYAGTMKGVVLSVCPEAVLVDISHDVPPHDVLAGALELADSYRYFPDHTIFLVVIDPGVGSSRRGIAAEAGAYRFVAPDNGVLSAVFDELKPTTVVELKNPQYARPLISRTFEGRDRFGPAAAWLARGTRLADLGPEVHGTERLKMPQPRVTRDAADGEVIRIDRFGNLTTNIRRSDVEPLVRSGRVRVAIAGRHLAGVSSVYAEAPPGALCALFGSTDRLEIAANGASAAELLGVGRGAAVRVSAIA